MPHTHARSHAAFVLNRNAVKRAARCGGGGGCSRVGGNTSILQQLKTRGMTSVPLAIQRVHNYSAVTWGTLQYVSNDTPSDE